MKILIEENQAPPSRTHDREDLRKVTMAFDALKPNQSLFLPAKELADGYKTMELAATGLRNGIKKRKRDPDATPIVRAYEEGVRIWKKISA